MRRNILIVDDDKVTQDLVSFFLEQAGFSVRVCKDGFTAIEELEVNHYDLVILDIAMPNMNGFQALKAIRANDKYKAVPVLMLTGSKEASDIQRARSFGVTDYVIKPPQRDDILSRIERVLGGKPQFEEIDLGDAEVAMGHIEVPVRIKNLSKRGMTIQTPFEISRGYVFEVISLELLKNLNIELTKFKITDCMPDESEEGKFLFFISFLGMAKTDQDKLTEWIVSRTLKRKGA